jgi:hypothetical protein
MGVPQAVTLPVGRFEKAGKKRNDEYARFIQRFTE